MFVHGPYFPDHTAARDGRLIFLKLVDYVNKYHGNKQDAVKYDSVERFIAETFVVFIHVEKRTEKNLKNAGKTI